MRGLSFRCRNYLFSTDRPRHRCVRRRLAKPSLSPLMVMATAQPHPDIAEVLLTETQIAERVSLVAKSIAADYADKRTLIVGTMKGAVIFMSDLVRGIDPVPTGLQLDFIRASSYGSGTVSSGNVSLTNADPMENVQGWHVLLVEDIVDSGRTAVRLKQYYQEAGAASVKLVSLLSKPSRREIDYEPDYCCFEVEDKFVVGYGLDFDQAYRTLPYVGVLRPECYTPKDS